jgi:CDP-glycerol glycerophosphotransferase (TagB/SpsB family)
MAVSDAMVSDHSSIAFEYLLLDRPLVVIDRPGLIEHARINPEKVHQLRGAAAVVRNTEEVARSVMRALRNPRELSNSRALIAASLFYKPGTATERALAHLYRILDLPIASRPAPEAVVERRRVAVG